MNRIVPNNIVRDDDRSDTVPNRCTFCSSNIESLADELWIARKKLKPANILQRQIDSSWQQRNCCLTQRKTTKLSSIPQRRRIMMTYQHPFCLRLVALPLEVQPACRILASVLALISYKTNVFTISIVKNVDIFPKILFGGIGETNT